MLGEKNFLNTKLITKYFKLWKIRKRVHRDQNLFSFKKNLVFQTANVGAKNPK